MAEAEQSGGTRAELNGGARAEVDDADEVGAKEDGVEEVEESR
jgi:hypothetical protein